MTPEQIQTELKKAIQEEINRFAVNELTDFAHSVLDKFKSNRSEKPNSCDHYIPQPGEVVEVSWNKKEWSKRIFLEYQKEDENPYLCVKNSHFDSVIINYRNGGKYDIINFPFCRCLSGEIIEFGCDKYTHLLPTGYEFCTEEEAEKWVKVENHMYGSYCVGDILLGKPVGELKDCSRPIRPIQYHVAVHDVLTAEPNPYAVDWSNAPKEADTHAFDKSGKGWFYGLRFNDMFWYAGVFDVSGFTLPTGLDWTKSKTTRP